MLHVFRDERSKSSVNSPLIEVSLHYDLQVLVEVSEWRASVPGLSLPFLLGVLRVGELCLGVEGNIIDLDETIARKYIDVHSALTGFLDEHGDACREGRVHVIKSFLVLRVLRQLLLVLLGACWLRLLVGEFFVVLIWKGLVGFWFFSRGFEIVDGEGEFDAVVRTSLSNAKSRPS